MSRTTSRLSSPYARARSRSTAVVDRSDRKCASEAGNLVSGWPAPKNSRGNPSDMQIRARTACVGFAGPVSNCAIAVGLRSTSRASADFVFPRSRRATVSLVLSKSVEAAGGLGRPLTPHQRPPAAASGLPAAPQSGADRMPARRTSVHGSVSPASHRARPATATSSRRMRSSTSRLERQATRTSYRRACHQPTEPSSAARPRSHSPQRTQARSAAHAAVAIHPGLERFPSQSRSGPDSRPPKAGTAPSSGSVRERMAPSSAQSRSQVASA